MDRNTNGARMRRLAQSALVGLLLATAGAARAQDGTGNDCGPMPDILTETADAAQIRCALTASQSEAMTRGITVVQTEAEVQGAPFAIQFEFGSADLTPASQDLLTRVAGVIAADEALRVAAYFIDGHTDAVGSDEANQMLGAARAASAATHLRAQVDFPLRLEVRSFGETRLLDAGDPEAARNRRVEITPVALE